MQAEQRAKIAEEQFEPQDDLWPPFTVHGDVGDETKPLEVVPDDAYVVVEDIQDERVVLEVSRWPRLDRDGRLYFDGDPGELYEDLDTAQAAVNDAREADSVTAPDRPLRIGDVFAVRGLTKDADSITAAGHIWDISLAGRDAAKAALYGAAASTVPPEYEEKMALSTDPVELSADSGEFNVAQSRPSKYRERPSPRSRRREEEQ